MLSSCFLSGYLIGKTEHPEKKKDCFFLLSTEIKLIKQKLNYSNGTDPEVGNEYQDETQILPLQFIIIIILFNIYLNKGGNT